MSDPSLDLQLTWRGTHGRLRVWRTHVAVETSYEQSAVVAVPMDRVRGWRVVACDHDAVCVEFVTADDPFRVLLDLGDEDVVRTALGRVLGAPLPQEPSAIAGTADAEGTAGLADAGVPQEDRPAP